jgi:hypothetical protein
VKDGRVFVRVAALVAAGMYGITGLVYLVTSGTPINIWLATLWLIGGCAVTAGGVGQEKAAGGGRVFALAVLAFLVGAALAAEAMGLAISSDVVGGSAVPALVHPLGFILSWPVFLLALIEGVFALGERP